MRKLLLGTTALLFAAPAMAADLRSPVLVTKAPVAPTEYFTGFYAGVNAGWGWSNDTVSASGADQPTQNAIDWLGSIGVPTSLSPKGSGGVIGGQLGYNIRYNFFVVGIETDLDWSNISGSDSWDNLGHQVRRGIPSATSLTAQTDLDWLGTTRARLGFLVGPDWLWYATGGLAYGGVKTTGTIKLPPDQFSTSNTETRLGWSAGAGSEYALTDHWLIRAEWLHYDLGTGHFTIPDSTVVLNTQAKGDILRGGVSYKF